MDLNYKGLQAENYTLRDYIVRLQSRLLDTQGDYPQPPAGVSLAHPTQAQQQQQQQLRHPESAANALAPGANPLEVAAQAVAGLTRGEHLAAAVRDPYGVPLHAVAAAAADEDVRTAEEITRQLKAEGGGDGLPAAAM